MNAQQNRSILYTWNFCKNRDYQWWTAWMFSSRRRFERT